MIAFHGDEKIKQKYLDRIKAHAAADEIIRGIYWENGKGCAVGCTIHSNKHDAYESELGIPQILARLEDKIFEDLQNELAMTWPERFLNSIPVGKDLSRVWPKFAIFLLTDPTQCHSRHPQCQIVAEAYQRQLDGIDQDWPQIKAAACAVYAATYATAYTGYIIAGSDDAYAAACAVYAADSDAYAAPAYAVYAGAGRRAWIAQSEKLLELLSE